MLAIEFGSKKRGDFNMSSDKDMLLIGSNFTQLLKEKERRKIEGYSVSCMTTDKAKYLVGQGSLFFKHIIDEGSLITGNHDEHFEIIKHWKASPNYQNDIEGNVELLEILSQVPKTSEGILAATDLLTISIRNILIRKLALVGLYVFSWEKVSSLAVMHDLIELNEKTILLHARHIKNYYRQGYNVQISEFFLERLLGILGGILGKKIDFRFGKKSDIVQLPEKCNDGSYKQLRAIEFLCAFYGFDLSPHEFIIWIKDPNFFCSLKGPNQALHQTGRSAAALDAAFY